MEIAKGKGIIVADLMMEQHDFISNLPDEVLSIILSLLPLDEAVRTSVLSKRWMPMWKKTSHLDFDVKRMVYPLTSLYIPPRTHSGFILDQLPKEVGVFRYSILFYLILKQHFGHLISCRLFHLPHDGVKSWIRLLLGKNKALKDLILECQPNGTTLRQKLGLNINEWKCFFSSLQSLELVRYSLLDQFSVVTSRNLKTLKLKEVHVGDDVIDAILKGCVSLEIFSLLQSIGFVKITVENSRLKFLELNILCLKELEIKAPSLEVVVLSYLFCLAKNVSLRTPSLREFHCNNSRPSSNPSYVLTTHQLLEDCSGLLESGDGKSFRNLSSLEVDFDLNIKREAYSLLYILKTCNYLETLTIILPVNKTCPNDETGAAGSALTHPHSTIWEGREICNCLDHKLKFVYIEGFTGTDVEVDFIKYLIERSTEMKSITMICDISIEDANGLLPTIRNAAPNLSITLMTAERDF